jgi:hypothetical protein
MADQTPFIVEDIDSAVVTREGQAAVVLKTNQGPLQLEFGPQLGGKMLELFARLQRPEVPEEGKSMEVAAFPVAWWTLGRTPDNNAMVLTFELDGGGHLGFQVPMDQALRLKDAMNTAAQRSGASRA